jgi:DNA topoisomerase-3
MRLFIAEKPDMGRKIAAVLSNQVQKKDGHVEAGGDVVSWCFGHLLEQAPPGAYDERYAKFPGKMEDLPVVPTNWKVEVVDGKQKQIAVLRQLLKQCSEVVHAGDPGREGQLIIDEVLDFLGNKKPVKRLILNALDKPTIQKALANLYPNEDYFTLYQAALGRQRADWMVGMNLSRAYTILADRQGYRGVLSMGRVQTPTLAIVVKRDEEIENFVAKDFWTIAAQFAADIAPDEPFKCRWLPHGADASAEDDDGKDPLDREDEENEDAVEPTAEELQAAQANRPAWLDDKNRIVVQAQADKIVAEVKAAGKGNITSAVHKPAVEAPPLPFELTALQSELNRITGASIKQVLEACQSLYEKGHVSYPRTDCAYLPPTQFSDAPGVLEAIGKVDPELAAFLPQTDPQRQSRAWDAKKMEKQEHHAIIPTGTPPNLADFPPLEQALYKAVAKRYLAQFMPECRVDKSAIEIDCAGHRFVARGRIVRQNGWRDLYKNDTQEAAKTNEAATALPPVEAGQQAKLKDAKVSGSRTSPPPRFTQGMLVKAMKHVDRLVDDPIERKKLKVVEGIGRSATRAAIIDNLLKREFLVPEKGKALISSPVARILVNAAPKPLTDPGLTARWETVLDAVGTGQISLGTFEQKQTAWLTTLVQGAAATTLPQMPAQAPRAPYSGGGAGKSSSGKTSSKSAPKSGGAKAAGGGKTCPKCKKGTMREREVKNGPKAGQKFKGCSNYPECNHSEWPK